MNILVFSWRDPKHPLAGGAEQVMHQHMKGWVKAGHKVTLFSSRLKNLPKEEGIDGVHIVRQGNQYLGVQIAGLFYYLKNKKNIDLVVDQFHGLPFFTPFYSRKPKLAVIQETAREVWFLNSLPWPLNKLIGIIGFLGEPLIFLFYKHVPFMTGSDSAKVEVEKLGIPQKNITVVPHGVISEKPYPTPKKENKFTIVFLGVLSKDKGIEDALVCFSKLKERHGFQYWVIGKPETARYRKKINKLVKSLNLKDKVKFWGYVPQKKKFELLIKAHLLINPSVREGWGLVNIEANSMGIPVIAYRSTGLVDSVNDGYSGIVCENNSPEHLAKNVNILFNDKNKLVKLQRGALIWSRNFSWKRSQCLSFNLIKKIIKFS